MEKKHLSCVFLVLYAVVLNLFAADQDAKENDVSPYVQILKSMGYEQKQLQFLSPPHEFSINDLDRKLEEILLPGDEYDPLSQSYPFRRVNLEFRRLAAKYGFSVQAGTRVKYPRDFAPQTDAILKCMTIPPGDAQILEKINVYYTNDFHPHAFISAQFSPLSEAVTSKTVAVYIHARSEYFRYLHDGLPDANNPELQQDRCLEIDMPGADLAPKPLLEQKWTHGLYDGGNLITLTNMQGARVALLGETTAALNHLMLRSAHFFKEDPDACAWVKERAADNARNWSRGRKAGKEFLDALFFKIKVLANMALVDNPKYDRRDQQIVNAAISIVNNFFAQRDYVNEIVTLKDLGIRHAKRITQLGYHLDLFLAPAPGGRILVMDLKKSAELLAEIAEGMSRPSDSTMAAVLSATQKAAKDLAAITELVVNELTEAGFEVIRAPSLFVLGEAGGSPISFLNPIYGKIGAGQYFWATLDPLTNEGLTAIAEELKEAWTVFLKQFVFHGYDLSLEFLPGASERMAGSLAGAHCLHVELPVRR